MSVAAALGAVLLLCSTFLALLSLQEYAIIIDLMAHWYGRESEDVCESRAQLACVDRDRVRCRLSNRKRIIRVVYWLTTQR